MGSAEMCRDLATEVEKLLLERSPPYVRKKVRWRDSRYLSLQKLSCLPIWQGRGAYPGRPLSSLILLTSAGCSDCGAHDPKSP